MPNPFKLLKRKAKPAIAVGCTDSGVCLIQVHRSKSAISAPIWEFAPADSPAEQTESLKEAVNSLKLGGRKAFGCLTGGHYSLLMVDNPGVEAEERNEALGWQIQDMLEFPLDEAVIDAIEAPERRDGSKKLFAVAARRSEVDTVVTQLTDAGLSPATVDIPEQAIRNVLAQLPDGDKASAYLHLDARQGVIVLAVEQAPVLSRPLDLGYEDIRLTLGTAAEPHEQDADSDSLELDLDLPRISDSASALLDRLALEIQRSMDYYDSSFTQYRLGRLYLSPIFQDMPDAVRYLNENLSIEVDALDLNQWVSTAEPPGAELQNRSLLTLGLALRALDDGE